jgi:hypothetical protein
MFYKFCKYFTSLGEQMFGFQKALHILGLTKINMQFSKFFWISKDFVYSMAY